MLSWFLQWAFCFVVVTVVSGGVAERVQFPGYLTFAVFMASLLYRVVFRWTWSWVTSLSRVSGRRCAVRRQVSGRSLPS